MSKERYELYATLLSSINPISKNYNATILKLLTKYTEDNML